VLVLAFSPGLSSGSSDNFLFIMKPVYRDGEAESYVL